MFSIYDKLTDYDNIKYLGIYIFKYNQQKVNNNSYFLPSICSILTLQSSMRSLTRAFRGAIYTAYKRNKHKTKQCHMLCLKNFSHKNIVKLPKKHCRLNHKTTTYSAKQYKQQQLFHVPLSGSTRVSQYQKKDSPTHTYPDYQPSFISFLHLL